MYDTLLPSYFPVFASTCSCPVFIQEYSVGDLDAPFLRQTITLPFSDDLVAQRGQTGTRLCTSNNRGDTGVESMLTLSLDGKSVSYGCYAAAAYDTNYTQRDKVVVLIKQDGSYDSRVYFTDGFASRPGTPNSFISTLYDGVNRFWVNGYNGSAAGNGMRTFTADETTVGTARTTDPVYMGQTFRHLGFDFARQNLLCGINQAATTLGYIARIGNAGNAAIGGFPTGNVVGSTAQLIPFQSGSGSAGYWPSSATDMWAAGAYCVC